MWSATPAVGLNVNSLEAAVLSVCNVIMNPNRWPWSKFQRNWVSWTLNEPSLRPEYLNLFFFFFFHAFSDRESSTFIQIAQFCNFINDSHQLDDENLFNGTLDASLRPIVVTFITGDRLTDKKLCNISFTGIMDAIGIHFETITEFYAKYKKKWSNATHAQLEYWI